MRIIFICFLLISSSFAQWYYKFNELKGMEDYTGNTVLFYRLFDKKENPAQYFFSEENSIYKYDPGTGNETLFLTDYDYADYVGWYKKTVHDFDFWDNNPDRYIFSYSTAPDLGTFIKRFDDEFGGYSTNSFWSYTNLEISTQDDSLVYGTGSFLIQSTDGGWNWVELPLQDFSFLELSPFDDQVIFGQNYNGELFKSTDGGQSSFLVDSSHSWISFGRGYNANQFEFDKDSAHIYRVYINSGQYFFSVSNNKGNPFTWSVKHSSHNKIFISPDYSQSGSIYLADGRRIYFSDNYGSTFSEYKVLDRKIVGIYKKPGSDKLYAATKYDLYEITPDSTKLIKHLPIDPEVFDWYPLAVGNKWIYDYTFVGDTSTETGIIVIEVRGDTLINNQHYFLLNSYNNFLRGDSLTGRIYKAYAFSNNFEEHLFVDLTLDVGDTLALDTLGYGYLTLRYEEPFNQWNLNSVQRNFDVYGTGIEHHFSLVKGIGLYYEFMWELVGSQIDLRGCVIDGIVYGDTTTVDVNEPSEQPKEFSLSQNYPNPFNPTTSIEYRVGSIEKVTLKIYDILGREVATLVNEEKQPGVYEVEFNAASGIGNLASGVYCYQLKAMPVSRQARNFVETKKMIYLK